MDAGGRIEVAMTYLNALVSHDSASVLLADGVRRIDNGRVVLEGAEALRGIIEREPVAAIHDLRWVVDGDDAVVAYHLDADLGREGDKLSPPDTWIPAYIAERFHVAGGMIHEIEVVFATAVARSTHARSADDLTADAVAHLAGDATDVRWYTEGDVAVAFFSRDGQVAATRFERDGQTLEVEEVTPAPR